MKRLKVTFNSPVVLTFVLLCFGATILNYLTAGAANNVIFATFRSPLTNPLTYVRFFSHVLGHMNFEHFMGNAMYLLLLGPMLEEKYGGETLIGVILITGFITGLVNYIFFPSVALCGASGVVFAFILMTSFTGFKEGEIPLTFILVAAVYIGEQVLEGLFIKDNVSNMGHIIGGMVGSVIGYQLNKK